MRFAVSRFSKAIVIGVLGCAAAVLVACGDSNGLLPGDRASSLDSALDGVSAACARGLPERAQAAVLRVRQQIDELPADGVDPRLVRNLQEGVATVEELIPQTCTAVTETQPTITEVVPPPADTTPQTTPETTPSETPTTPDSGGGTTPPDSGGGTTTPPDTGGGTTPDTGGGTPDTGGGTPDAGSGGSTGGANQGNPGGAGLPGEGGTTP